MADETTTENPTVDETEDKAKETEETTPPATEDKPEEKPEDKAGDTSDEPKDEDEGDPNEDLDSLPEWASKSLKKARTDAAHQRTRLKELEKKFEGAKTPEEVEALRQELATENAKLARDAAVERALRKHGLDDDDVIFLTASDPEDILKQAEALATRTAPSGPRRLKGGLVPDDGDSTPADPRELARLTRRG